ncbi:MAG TPA: sigma-70 family RNA polymerase sigma factor, partial [Verrucomicrobiae bacterium]|nr:sigma-70 family RNA polymerase sigma factor [Verrucomicrobiae bacterium]
ESQSDLDLLRQYATDGSQPAFTALVQRHINLVYSALRQIRSPQLAEEITQSVFTDLARNAAKLIMAPGGSPVAAWLYQVARRTAIDGIRQESRRQLREQVAMEMNAMNAAATWTEIAPLLDDAMAALAETDRTAILLRYFENKSLAEVGAALDTSDDTAQKRVSRAVDQLREFFDKRKITTTAAALSVVISANAIQAAPAGLAATITTTVLAGTAATTIIATTQTTAMTILQKTVLTAALATTVGTGIFAAHQTTRLHEETRSFQQQLAPLTAQILQLQQDRQTSAQTANSSAEETEQNRKNNLELLHLRGQVTTLQNQLAQANQSAPAATPDAVEIADLPMDTPVGISFLKQQFRIHPEWSIPELQDLNDLDWLNLVKTMGHTSMTDQDGVRQAMSRARSTAKQNFGNRLRQALNSYAATNSGNLPANLLELKTYLDSQRKVRVPSPSMRFQTFPPGTPPPRFFSPYTNYPPMELATLQRYQMLQTGSTNDLGPNQYIISEKSPVDDKFDSLIEIGLHNFFTYGTGQNTAFIGWSGTPDLDTMTPEQKKRYADTIAQQPAWNTTAAADQSAADQEFQKNFLNAMTPEERKKFEKISPPTTP